MIINSGAAASLIAKEHVEDYHITCEADTAWYIFAGYFHTYGIIKAKFALLELNAAEKVIYALHLEPALVAYNIILGRDILQELGIVINFNMQIVAWNHTCISMKPSDCSMKDSWTATVLDDVNDMVSRLTEEQHNTL